MISIRTIHYPTPTIEVKPCTRACSANPTITPATCPQTEYLADTTKAAAYIPHPLLQELMMRREQVRDNIPASKASFQRAPGDATELIRAVVPTPSIPPMGAEIYSSKGRPLTLTKPTEKITRA